MAILKMITTYHPTKAGKYYTLCNGLNYILNNKKTNNGLYTNSLNCNKDSALEDMINTKKYYGKESDSSKDRTGYHWTISWLPEEHVDYGIAMAVVGEFCEKFLKDYECVYSVHTDKSHTHAHLIFNSVSFNTGKKFRYENGDWAKYMQPILDELCQKYGLHTLEMDTGMTNEQYYNENINKKGNKSKYKKDSDKQTHRRGNNKYYNEKNDKYTKSEFIKKDIDDAILSSHSLSEFFMLLEEWGYKIKHGKSEKYGDYFAVKGRGMERFRRNYALGKGYGLESIKKRIDIKNNPLPEYKNNERKMEPDMRDYIVQYVYWKKPKYKVSLIQKQMYVLMYHTGILDKKNKRPNYYDIKNSMKKIREYEKNIELINEFKISDNETADIAINDIDVMISEIDNKRKDVYIKRKPYMNLIKTYNELKKVEMAYYMYENGINEYKEQHDKYLELKGILDKYGFAEKDIEKYQEDLKDELKDLYKEKRQLKKKINTINNIKEVINERAYDDKELEQEYNNIPEPDTFNKKRVNDVEQEQKEQKKNKQYR